MAKCKVKLKLIVMTISYRPIMTQHVDMCAANCSKIVSNRGFGVCGEGWENILRNEENIL